MSRVNDQDIFGFTFISLRQHSASTQFTQNKLAVATTKAERGKKINRRNRVFVTNKLAYNITNYTQTDNRERSERKETHQTFGISILELSFHTVI